MKVSKLDYIFKMQDIDETAVCIFDMFNNCKYKGVDKSKILNLFKLEQKDVKDICKIRCAVNNLHNKNNEKYNMCFNLQEMWDDYKQKFYDCIEREIGIQISDMASCNVVCYLHELPIDEINFEDNTLLLNCNRSPEDMFKSFVIMLTKILILDKWKLENNWDWDYSFRSNNLIWLFVEIAVDAIFANSQLKDISEYPSYKYFYTININGTNCLEHFRELYKKVCLEDFFDSVFMFTKQHKELLLRFNNYLY